VQHLVSGAAPHQAARFADLASCSFHCRVNIQQGAFNSVERREAFHESGECHSQLNPQSAVLEVVAVPPRFFEPHRKHMQQRIRTGDTSRCILGPELALEVAGGELRRCENSIGDGFEALPQILDRQFEASPPGTGCPRLLQQKEIRDRRIHRHGWQLLARFVILVHAPQAATRSRQHLRLLTNQGDANRRDS
jgi:hypothetical protein